MAKKIIRFVGNAAPYFSGDIAGFDSEMAERYIAAGLAIEPLSAPLTQGRIATELNAPRSAASEEPPPSEPAPAAIPVPARKPK